MINNVETFANVTAIINYGAEWFAASARKRAAGPRSSPWPARSATPAWSKCPWARRSREVVSGIGGGAVGGKEIKAVQTGGPAGGCIPAAWLDTPVDFDTLAKAGSIMGSGGMIVLDETDCMVDIAQYFMAFSQDESCGKCTPCREGTKRMLEILNRITGGQGTMEDLDRLRRLALLVKKSSLCGLGRAAPNPVLSTLEHYRDEYLAHVVEQPLPGEEVQGPGPLRDQPREVHRLHGVREELPGRVHFGQRGSLRT